jgi:hypothetical protein
MNENNVLDYCLKLGCSMGSCSLLPRHEKFGYFLTYVQYHAVYRIELILIVDPTYFKCGFNKNFSPF